MAQVRASWAARLDSFRRFEAEAGNLRQVMSRCVASDDAETGLRICVVHAPGLDRAGIVRRGLGMVRCLPRPPGARRACRGARRCAGRPCAARAGYRPGARRRNAPGPGLSSAGRRTRSSGFSSALNLLAEIALHSGRLDESAAAADEAIAVSAQAGDRWNEGYALGTRGAVAGHQGDLAAAKLHADAALAVMREIDQQWGVARTLLGLGDLARLTGAADVARRHYLEALGILREVNARPEIARCLAGLGRIALDQGDLAQARQQFAESMVLSQSSGSRIGVIRGLDAFAALAARRGRPDRAVPLAAAAEALRAAAHLPPPGLGTKRILDAAAELGGASPLWTAGSELTSADAVALALDAPPVPDRAGSGSVLAARVMVVPVVSVQAAIGPVTTRREWQPDGAGADGQPDILTAREHEIAALIADGHRTKGIADRAIHQPGHSGPAHRQHHGQARIQLTCADRRVAAVAGQS